ncbi:hypothetical protein F4806DRAFT_269285 [Annulohypoxylon nitens]|nr:hypothetical protein F4806DRAFT_269285 [Annulohypoxylon nitens]
MMESDGDSLMGLRAGENRYWELIVGKMGGDCSAKESLELGVWHFPSGLKVVPSSWIHTYFRYISTHSTIVARCTPAPSLLSQSNPWVSQWTEQSTVSKRASGNVHHIISNVQPLGNQVHRLPDASTTKYRTYILPHFQGYGQSKKRRRRPFFRGLRLMRLRGESQFDQTYMNASTDHVQFNPPTRHGLATLIGVKLFQVHWIALEHYIYVHCLYRLALKLIYRHTNTSTTHTIHTNSYMHIT